MKMRARWIGLAAVALAVGIGGYAFRAWSEEAGPGFGPPFMRHGMTRHGMMGGGTGPGPMGMGFAPGMTMHGNLDEATSSQMGVIHELLANHERIKRTVTNLPNGIRTVTESDDPQIAGWIKTHVASMRGRVDAGDDPGLPIETPALHAIFRDKDKIRTTAQTTETGVAVVQTSDDADTVAALQTHAAEVSDLVQGGMPALHTAMMRNGGPMMRGGMMRGPGMHGHMPFGGMRGPM